MAAHGSQEKRSELVVGLFLFVGLAFLGALILQFGRVGDRFLDKYTLSVVFEDAAGLIKGSDVRMGGAKIGQVAETPALNDELKVQVEMWIDERVRIPSESKFQIASATLLGDKQVVVTPPVERDGSFVEPESRVVGSAPGGLDALQNNAEEFSREVREMMQEASEALDNLDNAVTDIRGVTTGLRDVVGKLDNEVLSEDNLESFNRSLTDLEETLAGMKAAGEKLGPTVDDAREAIGSFKEASEGARNTFAKVDEKLEQLGPALEEMPGAVRSLSSAADKAGNALDSMSDGEGLLGTMVYDRDVSTDAKTFIGNLRQYGILRYRDAETKKELDPRNRFRGHRR